MKILIIQHKRIGDVLVSSLLCENIKKVFPDATVDYLVNTNTLAVLENNPYIDNIIVFNKAKNTGLLNAIKYSKEINKKNQYDIIIDVYAKIQSWIFTFYSKAGKKISHKKNGRNFFHTDIITKHKEPHTNLGLAIEHRLALLKPLGITKPLATQPKLYLTESEKEEGKQILISNQVNMNRKTIMISLLGSDDTKTYPLGEMTKMVDYIGNNYDVNILLNYLPSQKNEAEKIYNALSENTKSKVYFNIIADDLRTFIKIVNSCDLIIGNDGGAINMAKALEKKSFVIFAPHIDKKIWSTFEDGHNHIGVHAKDYLPESFNDNKKNIKKKKHQIYAQFTFDLFKEKLKYFLDSHLK